MRLYYTVSGIPLKEQSKPNLSLGGYQSATPVRNGSIGGVFGDISMYTVKNNNQNQYIALMLKNELAQNIENIKLWFTYNDTCYSILKIAVVDLASDESGSQLMEQIRSYSEQPIYATFVDATVDSKADLGAMNSGEMVGVWLQRTFDLDTIKTDQNAIYAKDPLDNYHYLPVELDTEDSININISYDLVT